MGIVARIVTAQVGGGLSCGQWQERTQTSCVPGECCGRRGDVVADTEDQIKFDVPAVLARWPTLNDEPVAGETPYIVAEGTLGECIQQFVSKPMSQAHLYEIHTAPQGELIAAVLSPQQIIELAAQWDFL
jgi:hypothetical protein